MKERAYWLAWSKISGVGPVTLQRLQQSFGSLATAWDATPASLCQVEGIGEQTARSLVAARSQLDPTELLDTHTRQNPNFWTPVDPDYPALLLEIPDPPPVLYYRGQVDLAECQGYKKTIAIVGTREPSEYGKRWARKLALALAEQGFTVVSGLAEGVDTQAHHGCLEVKGRTIAVLGTGVDLVYPPRNQDLFNRVQQNGLVVSEYPAGTGPQRAHFPRRNRIIAGLCRATLVIEAPNRSGALITAYLANDYGRDVYVLPGSLDNPKAIGCLGLLHRGAQVILGVGHLLELLGTMPQLDPGNASAAPPQPELAPELMALLRIVKNLSLNMPAGVPLDVIVQQQSQETGTVLSSLLQLELLGLVTQLPGMRYCASS